MRFFGLLFICGFMLACNSSQDEEFGLLYQQFQNEMDATPLMRAFLEQKLYFDSSGFLLKQHEIDQTLVFAKVQLEELHQFKPDRLDPSVHEHYHNLHSFLDIIIKNIETERVHQHKPAFYEPSHFLKSLMQQKEVNEIEKALVLVQKNYQAAIANLERASVEELDTTIQKSTACFEFLSDDLQTYIQSFEKGAERKKATLLALTKTKLGLKDYIGYCNSLLFEFRDSKPVKRKEIQ